jgi:long-chain acyl-CoA synthetase
MCSGAAPISANVMQFLRVGFSCPVIEGYGMTETCSGGTITNVDDYNVLGNVGSPLPSVEIKLADVPEMDYRSADMLNGVPHPRGEICFRGPGISLGYYNMPEQTKDAIDSEGWLHSGDIGVWLPEQGLKIIDRKKNIFKLSQGEYVAPEKIENIYQRSSFVAQAFVYGNSLEPSLVAILIPDEEFLVPWAEKNGFGKLDLKSLCAKPEIKKIIFNDLLKVSQAGGLHGFEICKAIHLDHVLFSMENDLLTPTMKLKRNVASDKYKDVIAQMYKDLSGQKQAQLSSKL